MAEDFTDVELDELEAAIHQLATHMKQRAARTNAQLERLATRMKQHALRVSGHYDRFEVSLQNLQHKIDLVAQGLDGLSPSSSVIVHAPLSLAAEITDDLSIVDDERGNAVNKEESPLAIDDTAPINVVLSSPLVEVLANDCETILEGDITFPNKDEAESFPMVNEMQFGPMCGISWSVVTTLPKAISVPCVHFDMIVPEIRTNQVWGITSVLDLFYNCDLAFTLVQSSLHTFLSVMPCKCLIYCYNQLHDSNVRFPLLARFCTYVFDPGTPKGWYKVLKVVGKVHSKGLDYHEGLSANYEDLDCHIMLCLLYFTIRFYDLLMMSFGPIVCVYLGQSGIKGSTIGLVVGLCSGSVSYFKYGNTNRFYRSVFSMLQFEPIFSCTMYVRWLERSPRSTLLIFNECFPERQSDRHVVTSVHVEAQIRPHMEELFRVWSVRARNSFYSCYFL